MDTQETIEETAAPTWPEMSADVSIARSVARAITLDTQRAATDGRVIELGSHLELVDGRLSEVERLLGDQLRGDDRSDELSVQIVALRSELDRTNAQLNDVANAPAATDSSETTLKLGIVNDRVTAIEDAHLRSNDQISEVMEYLEKAYTRLDGVSNAVDAVTAQQAASTAGTPELRAELSALSGSLSITQNHVVEIETHLRNDVEAVEARLASQVAEARGVLADQVNTQISGVAADVNQIADRVGTIGGDLEGLTGQVNELEAQVAEARGVLADQVNTQISGVAADVNQIADRVGTIGGDLEGLTGQVNELEAQVAAKYVNAEVGVTEAQTALEEAREQLTAARDDLAARFDQAEQLLTTEVSTSTLEMAEKVGAAEDHLAAQVAEATLILTQSATTTEENLAGQVAEARDHLAALVDEAIARLDEREVQANVDPAEITRIDDSVAALTDDLDAVKAAVASDTERLDSLHARVDETLEAANNRDDEELNARFAELDDRVTHAVDEEVVRAIVSTEVAEQVGEIGERADSAHRRMDDVISHEAMAGHIDEAVARQSEEINERVDNAHSRIDEAHARIDETITGNFDTVESKFADLHTGVEEANGRLDDAQSAIDAHSTQFTQIREAVGDIESRIDTNAGTTAANTERLHAIDDRVRTTESNQALQHEASEHQSGRIDQVEARLTDIETQTPDVFAAIENRLTPVEQAVHSRIDDVGASLSAKHAATEQDLVNQVSAIQQGLSDHVVAVETTLAEQVGDVESKLAKQVGDVETNLAEQVAEARDVLTTQLRDAEVDLQLKLTKATKTGQLDGASVDEAQLAELEGGIAAASEAATQAQQFAEHLRILQTDLVHAVQNEIGSQSERIAALGGTVDNTDARLEHLESTIGAVLSMPSGDLGLAPASPENTARISKLEKRLDSMSSSSDDTRSAELDAQLQAALAKINETLDERTVEIGMLREQLDAANARLAELETTEKTVGSELTVDELMGKSDDEGSDWFVTSYNNRSKLKKNRKK